MNPVAKANAYLDAYMASILPRTAALGRPVRCMGKGCFWCCKEMVFVERREVVYLLAQVPPEALPELTEKTQRWWDGFFAGGFETMPAPNEIRGPEVLFHYRQAGLWCPLLKDGACSVYDHRPSGCRLFAVVKSPALCASDHARRRQEFLLTAEQDEVILNALNIMTAGEPLPRLQFDHLGIWLGHLLLGKTERTENAYEIETVLVWCNRNLLNNPHVQSLQ